METHLLIHNIITISTSVINIGLCLFIFLNNPRSQIHIIFAMTMLCAAIFSISHVAGVNISDPMISRDIFMLNIVTMFIAIFNAHALVIMTNSRRGPLSPIAFIYYVGIIFSVIFILYPSLFLLPSIPKMYFPNYYNPGALNFVRLIVTFVLGVGYMTYKLISSYIKEKDDKIRGQLKFFALTMILGYGLGFIPNFLVYNIQIDPLWGMAFAIFAVPLIYGVIKYELFHVKIIAKQAFVYSISVGLVGGLVLLTSYASELITTLYPNFPEWVIPFSISLMIVTSGVFVWKKLRENDLLKYEFVSTVTHKFRTPLTHIKWAAENISKLSNDPELRNELGYIESANGKLVELTTLIMNVSGAENSTYQYRFERSNLSKIIKEVVTGVEYQALAKKIKLSLEFASDVYVNCDHEKIKFIIQTFVENAIHYTPNGGNIIISLQKDEKNNAICSVKDSGIGITDNDMSRIFSKFYRGESARSLDTEGMGIGLYMTKEIIRKHSGGKIWAESKGQNLGSTFNFSLPLIS